MRRRVVEIAAYGVAAAAQSGTAFVMLPLLTRMLAPGEFGQWVLLEPVLVYGAQLALVGANYGLIKLIGKDELDLRYACRVVIPPASVVILFAAITSGLLTGWLAPDPLRRMGVALAIAAEGLFILALSALRGATATWRYALGVYAKAALLLAGTAFVFFNLAPSWHHPTIVVWLYAAASLFGAIVAFIVLSQLGAKKPERVPRPYPHAKLIYWSAIIYGAPILGAGLLSSLLSVGDRYFLSIFSSPPEVAVYVVQAKLANAINLIAMPINTWFLVARFQHVKDPDGGERFFSLMALVLLACYTSLACVLWLAMPQLIPWVVPGFEFDLLVSGLLAFSAVVAAMTVPLNVGLFAEGYTHWLMVITAASALVQIIGLVALIPIFGVAGAAGATAISQVINLAFIHRGSQQAHPINWPYGRLVFMLIGGTVLCLVIAQLLPEFPWETVTIFMLSFGALTALIFRVAKQSSV